MGSAPEYSGFRDGAGVKKWTWQSFGWNFTALKHQKSQRLKLSWKGLLHFWRVVSQKQGNNNFGASSWDGLCCLNPLEFGCFTCRDSLPKGWRSEVAIQWQPVVRLERSKVVRLLDLAPMEKAANLVIHDQFVNSSCYNLLNHVKSACPMLGLVWFLQFSNLVFSACLAQRPYSWAKRGTQNSAREDHRLWGHQEALEPRGFRKGMFLRWHNQF